MSADTVELSVNGVEYTPDLAFFSREPLVSNVQVQDADAEPGERALSRFGWKRGQSDFIYGAGQEWFDQEDESDRRRFYQSLGFEVRRGKLQSSKAGQIAHTFSSTSNNAGITQVSDGVVAWSDAEIVKITSFGGVVTTYTGTIPSGITDVAVIDNQVIVTNGTSMSKAPAGSTVLASWGSVAPDRFVVAGSRLLGFEGSELIEIDDSGAKLGSTIFDHPFTNFTWKGGVVAPNGVYLWGDDGLTSEIYLLVPTDATGEFAPPFPASDWPQGEIINQMIAYGGVVCTASNLGFRVAQIGGSGFLTYGPLQNDVGEIAGIAAVGENCFASVTNVSINGNTDNSGIAVFNLAKFADTLTPAYWTGAMMEDMGASATPLGVGYYISSLDPVPFVLVLNSDSGDREVWNFNFLIAANELLFRPGKITYGIPEKKQFLSIEFELENIHAGDTVGCTIDIDGTPTALTGSVEGKTYKFTHDSALSGRTFDPVLSITSATTSLFSRTLIELERWTIRALPLPQLVEVIEVGVILDPELQGSGRKLADPYAEWSAIQALAESKEIVELRIGDRIDSGYVDAFMAPAGSQKDTLHRGATGSYVQGVWTLRFVAASDAAV